MVLLAVTVFVSVAAPALVRAVTVTMKPNPWAVPWFAEWFAQWVEVQSAADHRDPEPAAVELESVVAVLTRPLLAV